MVNQRSKVLKWLAVLTVVATLALGISGCTSSKKVTAKKALNVVMVPKFTGFPYFVSAKAGGVMASKELGVTNFKYVGTTTADTQGEVQVLQNLVPQKPDVVVAAIMDKDALLPVCKRLKQEGTIVITFDDDVAPGGQNLYINMASFNQQAQAMLENCLACNPNGRKLVWVAPSATDASFQGKLAGIKWCIQNIPRYKGFQIIDTLYTNDDPQTGYSMALSEMKAHPDMSGFVSGSGMTNPPMNKAIMDSGNIGKIYCTGFAIPGTMDTYVGNGTCKEYSLWDPQMYGYMATYIGEQVANHKLTLSAGLTINIPHIGERTITSENGELIMNLNDMMFFDKAHDTYATGIPMANILKGVGVKSVS
jgi:ABC-type sugar transport system substrate-binding protein